MADIRDEHGNPIQLTDEFGKPVQLTDEFGNPIHIKGVVATGQEQLHLSGSSSSSSSEDDGQGGRRKKKGPKEKIKEMEEKMEETIGTGGHAHTVPTAAGHVVPPTAGHNVPTADVYSVMAATTLHTVPGGTIPPGATAHSVPAVTTTTARSRTVLPEGGKEKEEVHHKKGVMEKIKDKLSGHHNRGNH